MIVDESPHLANALKSAAPLSDFRLLDAAFDFSIQHGGRSELDFFREPGVSYNPRPARIGLILLKVAEIKDSTILAAAMLATVPEMLAEARELFPEAVYSPAVSAQLPPVELFSIHLDTRLREEISYGASISVALWLDRARHLHLSSPDLAIWRNFLEETVQYVTLARWCSPPIAILLEAWTVRFARRVATLDR